MAFADATSYAQVPASTGSVSLGNFWVAWGEFSDTRTTEPSTEQSLTHSLTDSYTVTLESATTATLPPTITASTRSILPTPTPTCTGHGSAGKSSAGTIPVSGGSLVTGSAGFAPNESTYGTNTTLPWSIPSLRPLPYHPPNGSPSGAATPLAMIHLFWVEISCLSVVLYNQWA
jgi:hypothetical protein